MPLSTNPWYVGGLEADSWELHRVRPTVARNRAATCPHCGLVWAHHDVEGWVFAHYFGPTVCPECGTESMWDARHGRRLVTDADRER